MAPTRVLPSPLTLSPYDMSEKAGLPAIILTPSSPLDATDYQMMFLPPPPKPRRRPLLAPLFRWRQQRAIQLPTSAHEPAFPVGTVSKTRRNRALLLLAIPLVIVVAHLLLAFAANSRVGAFPAHASDSLLDTVYRVFGVSSPAPAPELAALAPEPTLVVPDLD